jgi:hypothetical protein
MTVISISTSVVSSLKGRKVCIWPEHSVVRDEEYHYDSDASEGDDDDLFTSLFM